MGALGSSNSMHPYMQRMIGASHSMVEFLAAFNQRVPGSASLSMVFILFLI